jgi:hypothetical protein
MSGKFKGIKRKIKDVVSLCIVFTPIMLLALLFAIVMLIVTAAIHGVIISICWNVAMTTMFGFQKITFFKAFVLAFTIGCLRSNYLSSGMSAYSKLKKKIFDKTKKEKMSKVLSLIFVVIFELISILITVCLVMYSWNNILPQLLKIDLVQINFWQAFGFAYLLNLLFSNSESDDKESKENEKKESQEINKTNYDTATDVETIEVESVLEDEPVK